jgi:uncharacterized protein YegL
VTKHVFISYQHADRPYVDKLAIHLRESGLDVWYDYAIQPGERFAARIQKAIDECGVFVPVLTPAAVDSEWVFREVSLAAELGKPMLPVLLMACTTPLVLAGLLREDVTNANLPSGKFINRLRFLTATMPYLPTFRTVMGRYGASHRGGVLPWYLVIDVSSSTPRHWFDQIDRVIPAVSDALNMSPVLSDMIRISVFDFADDARVVLPLQDAVDRMSAQQLCTRGSRAFSPVLRLLREQLTHDRDELRAAGNLVHRPVIFLLNAGEPDDNWEYEFALLREMADRRWCPVIVPLLLGAADPTSMQIFASLPNTCEVVRVADAAGVAAVVDAAGKIFNESREDYISD